MIKAFFAPLEKFVREFGRVSMMLAESILLGFRPPFKLNYIFKQSKYPIYQGKYTMFPMEYCFSENNPILAQVNIRNDININQSIDINQTYTYNQYNYPTVINSNWGNFNIKFYYE